MRLDKFLSELNIGSRSQVKDLIRKGLITINGIPASAADQKIDEYQDAVAYRGEILRYQKFRYYMLNKPSGVVTATKDNLSKTVLELLPPQKRKNIFPVGRLDKDTEGLLLLTDDGELAHRLLAPNRHVDKTYLAEIARPLSEQDCLALEQGVDIGEAALTRPALVEKISEKEILLTIHEGKFHQVKRMLQTVGNKVTALKRVKFASLSLDKNLAPGEYRELTDSEVLSLNGNQTAGTPEHTHTP